MHKVTSMNQNPHESAATAELLLSCILDMGEILLTSGAEVVRVEDTLTRLCHAYGFTKVDVFTITSSIVLTVRQPNGSVFTQTRRITARDTNLNRIALVNSLSRRLCQSPLELSALQQAIEEIRQDSHYPSWVQLLAYIIISAAFTLFFGGTVLDALGACISGAVLFLTQSWVKRLNINSILQSLVTCAVTALAVVLLVRLGIGCKASSISIGNIMLLIPGVALTTALRDIINGDTISGILGICEAVVKALAVAIGFAAVLVQMGGL